MVVKLENVLDMDRMQRNDIDLSICVSPHCAGRLVRAGGPLVGGGMTWPPPTSCAAVAGKKRSFPQKVCATFVSIIRDHAFATRSDGYNR